MNTDIVVPLAWTIAAIALFSYLSVKTWAGARQREREAYYKSEAIKKLAEMEGTSSESILELVRQTLNTPKSDPTIWMSTGQARAYHQGEALKRIAGMPGGNVEAVMAFLQAEEKASARRMREGLRIGGAITCAVGVSLLVVLHVLVKQQPVYLVGLIPLFVGVVLLACGYFMNQAVPEDATSKTA